jgi:hypothetical protein
MTTATATLAAVQGSRGGDLAENGAAEHGAKSSWEGERREVDDEFGGPVSETEAAGDGEEGLEKEAENVKIARGPGAPTREELEEHRVTHFSYRSWCPHCIRGKSKASPHKQSAEDCKEKAMISIDYAFLGSPAEQGEVLTDEEALKRGYSPCLILWDHRGKGLYAYAVEKKGAEEGLIKRIVTDLDTMGYKEVILKSDQEPAIAKLGEVLKASFDNDMAIEYSPVRQSQCNGAVERAIQTWKGR